MTKPLTNKEKVTSPFNYSAAKIQLKEVAGSKYKAGTTYNELDWNTHAENT